MRALTNARSGRRPRAAARAPRRAGVRRRASKPRNVLILPFTTVDLTRDEQWIGEGIAQSLMLALVHVPGLVQIDRERLKRAARSRRRGTRRPPPAAAKQLGADVALFGEVKRTGADLIVQPRFLELRGDKVERGALDTFAVRGGPAPRPPARRCPPPTLKALKVPASDVESWRASRSGRAPTTSLRAYELYVRGRHASVPRHPGRRTRPPSSS